MSNNYNQFFNPNICHVCKMANNGNLIICDQCYMISYCSKEHRAIHNSAHMDICEVIHRLTSKNPQWNTRYLNMREWIQSRKAFLHLIKQELLRDLKSYEVQMIMFVKSCLICHQQTNLYSCTLCHSANYCMDHLEAFENLHNFRCKELLLSFSLDLELFRGIKCKLKFNRFPDERPVVDMDTFIKQYVQRPHASREVEDWHCQEYFYSDYTSGPLTLYYGMMDANLLDTIDIPDVPKIVDCDFDLSYVIHIIDATYLDRDYIPAWELVVHLLNNAKVLRLVLIGNELQEESNDNIDLCSKCKNLNQSLAFESHCMLYRNYVDSDLYKRPNLIIAFQADFSEGEEWSKLILKLQFQDCPLLITAKSKLIADQNVHIIQKLLNISINPSYHDRNKFCSRRPCRDIDTDYMSFRNDFVTIYRRLNNSKTLL